MILKVKEIIGNDYGEPFEVWVPDTAINIEIRHNQLHYDFSDVNFHDFQSLPVGLYEISN